MTEKIWDLGITGMGLTGNSTLSANNSNSTGKIPCPICGSEFNHSVGCPAMAANATGYPCPKTVIDPETEIKKAQEIKEIILEPSLARIRIRYRGEIISASTVDSYTGEDLQPI